MLLTKKSSLVLLLAAAVTIVLVPQAPRTLAAQTSALSEAAQTPAPSDARLVLYNTHTNERLDIPYRRAGQYLPEALAKLDYFLRDHNTGEVRHFDPRLYDILSALTVSVGRPSAEIAIVCGYRTPSTNEALRAHTTGVAKKRKPSTCASPASILSPCAAPHSRCAKAALATTRTPILFT